MKPLAERLRPITLEEFTGQEHLVGDGAILKKSLESGNLPSMILWGPPGVGKTTLAFIIAKYLKKTFYKLSAINSGVKDVREVIDKAKTRLIKRSVDASPNDETTIIDNKENINNIILFIDEIHRFNKAQQDSLLGAVEQGIITLIGATTENPSFEVISPLLSRCQVFILKNLDKSALLQIADKAIKEEARRFNKEIILEEDEALLRISGGDARKLINAIELVVISFKTDNNTVVKITNQKVIDVVQQNIAIYDKAGEQHYDIISAFIKSMRGSDPNATVYWLARMVAGGEDPKFIARRMLIFASEDIGNANPNALLLANNCFQAINVIGYPECELVLSQTAIYLATSVKSNASYLAISKAKETIHNTGDLPVPLHLRNAPTELMKEIGYSLNYKYAHNYSNNFIEQEFLPQQIKDTKLYEPQNNVRENEIRLRLKTLWGKKYNY
ncbi:MAG: replication-associated recombination protein A [Bacteroidales bacterium]|nr:replication-associated recombination protein A [Bacteroidales bacterium]